MKRWLLFAALACGWPRPAAAQTVAVVVGNNAPPAGVAGDGLSTLRYADDDAHRYAQLFERFADETILLTVYDQQTRTRLPDARVSGPPTLAALRKVLGAIEGEDLTVYVVFTGHGALDEAGAPFLSLLDAPLTRDVMFDEILADLRADRVHLIIDACHAAGVVGIRGGRFGKEIDGKTSAVTEEDEERWAKDRTLVRFPHVGVLASSSTGESSHEWSVLQAGVFSHEVLSGMWGAADINADRRVEYSELQSFVASANRAVDDPRAKPSVVVRPPALDPHAPLVDLGALRQAAMLEGDLSELGHFHVELADGTRHLDANVGGTVALAIPAGPAYLRAGQVEYALVANPGESLRFAGLKGRPLAAAARGSTEASFRQQLFAESYTYDYYRGYVDSVGATPVARPVRAVADPSPSPSPPPPAAVSGRIVEPPRDSAPRRSSPRWRPGGIALVSTSAVFAAAAIGTGVGAAVMRARFNAADSERNAEPYTRPHQTLATVAVGAAITSGITAVLGGLLLRKATRQQGED